MHVCLLICQCVISCAGHVDGLTQLHADVIQLRDAITRINMNTCTFVIMLATEMRCYPSQLLVLHYVFVSLS